MLTKKIQKLFIEKKVNLFLRDQHLSMSIEKLSKEQHFKQELAEHKTSGPKESPSAEKTLSEIYRLFTEIDRADESRLTQPLKNKLEEMWKSSHGELPDPVRLNTLLRETWKLYLDFQDQQETKRSHGHFIIFGGFSRFGKKGVGCLEITKTNNPRIFSTSEIGTGYTTTIEKDPDWLKIEMTGDTSQRCPTPNLEYGDIGYVEEETYTGTVLGVPCEIYSYLRTHENGVCSGYRFTFSSDTDVDAFQKKLAELLETQNLPDVQTFRHWVEERGWRFILDETENELVDEGHEIPDPFDDDYWQKARKHLIPLVYAPAMTKDKLKQAIVDLAQSAYAELVGDEDSEDDHEYHFEESDDRHSDEEKSWDDGNDEEDVEEEKEDYWNDEKGHI